MKTNLLLRIILFATLAAIPHSVNAQKNDAHGGFTAEVEISYTPKGRSEPILARVTADLTNSIDIPVLLGDKNYWLVELNLFEEEESGLKKVGINIHNIYKNTVDSSKSSVNTLFDGVFSVDWSNSFEFPVFESNGDKLFIKVVPLKED